jgi:hypothetical protein
VPYALKKPKVRISDKDRYDMRKMRVAGRTVRDIAVAKKVPYRQAYEAVADIKPSAKYTEDELKGSHLWGEIPEQSDEPQTPEGQDTSENVMEPEDLEFRDYLEAQDHILSYIRDAIEMGDEAAVEFGKQGFLHSHVLIRDYFRRNFPKFPSPPLSFRLLDQIETWQARSESSSTDSTSPRLERESAEFRRQTEELNEAEFMKDDEGITLHLQQDVQEDPSHVRDPDPSSG